MGKKASKKTNDDAPKEWSELTIGQKIFIVEKHTDSNCEGCSNWVVNVSKSIQIFPSMGNNEKGPLYSTTIPLENPVARGAAGWPAAFLW